MRRGSAEFYRTTVRGWIVFDKGTFSVRRVVPKRNRIERVGFALVLLDVNSFIGGDIPCGVLDHDGDAVMRESLGGAMC